jgi:hypothetical protein
MVTNISASECQKPARGTDLETVTKLWIEAAGSGYRGDQLKHSIEILILSADHIGKSRHVSISSGLDRPPALR